MWKEKLDLIALTRVTSANGVPTQLFDIEVLEQFIETEVIEKIIKDIPSQRWVSAKDKRNWKGDDAFAPNGFLEDLKQSLRAKWLKNNN